MLQIVADENMPALDALFGPYAEIHTYPGREIGPEQVKDADILLVRSVTKVDRALLEAASKLKFVGTATIGFDHLDIDALNERGIRWSNAPGCNAEAVGEYVTTALLTLAERESVALTGKTLGIIGAGNTGSAVAKRAGALGLKVLLCDPPLAEAGDERDFVELDALLAQADIVSCHVPLTQSGAHPTWYLLDESRLASLKPDTWLVNACRGEVIDNRALIEVKRQRPDLKLILDVWEGEPNPITELVELTEIATPHIAGYSVEAKLRGNWLLLAQLKQELGIDQLPAFAQFVPASELATLTIDDGALSGEQWQRLAARVARLVYDIDAEDRRFRRWHTQGGGFDKQRKAHLNRREFLSLAIASEQRQWQSLGFESKRV